MDLPQTFLDKFSSSIVSVLGCYDRVIFKGHLPFGDDGHLNSFVDYGLKIPRKDFLPMLQGKSQELVEHATNTAKQANAPFRHFPGKPNKEKVVEQIARERRHPDGLLAVLSVLETCRTVKLALGQGRPRLYFAKRPQRVLYYYFQDPEFGRTYIRLQTWFPYTIQVYVNGHEYLARQMQRSKLGFVQVDNCFTELAQPAQAQELADRFPGLPWQTQLNEWSRIVNPLLREAWLAPRGYYWVIEQAEYSTDVLFRSREALRELYFRFLDHAIVNFSAQDILTFLGRRWHPRFDGEVLTEYKKDRWPGARIKHRVKANWLKMYDKLGQVLRVETVINQPREFKVRRWRTRQGERQLVWCPMNKGIANFYQYHHAAQAANLRYLEALSVVGDPAPSYQQVETLVQPRLVGKRSYAGFNPAKQHDVQLFAAVLSGEHLLRGLRNADIRRILHGDTQPTQDRRRQAAAIGRRLKRLHVRGLLRKVPRTRRWLVTHKGSQILGAAVRLYYHGLSNAA
jgi:hypothetical protein